MYVGLKEPRGDGERCVTSAQVAAKETDVSPTSGLIEFIIGNGNFTGFLICIIRQTMTISLWQHNNYVILLVSSNLRHYRDGEINLKKGDYSNGY